VYWGLGGPFFTSWFLHDTAIQTLKTEEAVMETIVAWWTSMTLNLQVFYAIAIASTLALIGQLMLLMLGVGDADADLDVGHPDVDGADAADGGLHLISVRSVIAFLTGFGWTGVVTLKDELPKYAVFLAAVLVGGVFMVGVFYLMKALHSLRHSGTLDYKNAIGSTGTVYVPVPANMESAGQVEVMIQGRLAVVAAYNRGKQELPGQSKIKVIELLDARTLIVEAIK